MFAIPSMAEGRPLAISPPPDPRTPSPPLFLRSWRAGTLQKYLFSEPQLRLLWHLWRLKAGSSRGRQPRPRGVPALFPKPLICQSSAPHTPGRGPHHWVRSEDSTAATPSHRHYHHQPDSASPQRFGPGELAACGGIRISGKKSGAVVSLVKTKVFRHGVLPSNMSTDKRSEPNLERKT